MFEDEVNDYIDAWNSLPPSVQHIVVIRDDPKGLPGTQRCVERALAQHEAAGLRCRVPRRAALDRDAAAVAAERVGTPRAQVVDLTKFFCDERWCYPVIGGALVHKDQHHMTTVFVSTLGPYLLQAVDRLETTGKYPLLLGASLGALSNGHHRAPPAHGRAHVHHRRWDRNRSDLPPRARPS